MKVFAFAAKDTVEMAEIHFSATKELFNFTWTLFWYCVLGFLTSWNLPILTFAFLSGIHFEGLKGTDKIRQWVLKYGSLKDKLALFFLGFLQCLLLIGFAVAWINQSW